MFNGNKFRSVLTIRKYFYYHLLTNMYPKLFFVFHVYILSFFITLMLSEYTEQLVFYHIAQFLHLMQVYT